MLRAATFWFLSLWSALWASLDIMLILNGVDVAKHFVFLAVTVLFQLLVIRRWGPKDQEEEPEPPKDEKPPGPPGTV